MSELESAEAEKTEYDGEQAEWTLTITHGDVDAPRTITHTTTDVNGHDWSHVEGDTWQFHATDWDAIVTHVLTAVDEKMTEQAVGA